MRPLYILAITIALASCSQEANAPVARVDEVPISAESLRAFVEKLPPGLRHPEGGDAARRQYVQSLIDRQLILKEALAHGLDTLQSVQRAVDEAVDARVIALYRARNITAQIQVPEEDVRRVFAAEGYHRERKLNAILVGGHDRRRGRELGPDQGCSLRNPRLLFQGMRKALLPSGSRAFFIITEPKRTT